jgi:L-amino acid N-acyltransferase YncA
MTDILRLARPDDAPAIAAIYAPIVRDTAISFEVDPPSAEQMRSRIEKTLEMFPWLVAERDGAVAGYAYASRHRDRLAYQWSVDVACYVHADARRGGVGKRLYTALMRILPQQGLHRAYAGIALPNAASVALHESVGFVHLATYREVGFKHGGWHDVGWWEASLGAAAAHPEPPRALALLGPRVLDDL